MAVQNVTPETLHASSVIMEVAIADLQADRSYQREPNQRMIEKIKGEYDEIASELILVSDRGVREEDDPVSGGLWIVNGQHRTLAAYQLGLKHMHARVIDLSDHPDPASIEAMFRLRTNVRQPDSSLQRFKAQVRAGNPESIAITQICEMFETQVNDVPTAETGLNAPSMLERLYRIDRSGETLTTVFGLVKAIYGAVGGKSSGAAFLGGYGWFVLKHPPSEYDRERLVQTMHVTGTSALERRSQEIRASMGGPSWLNVYRAIIHYYNDGLGAKAKLEWKHGGYGTWRGGYASGSGGYSS